MERRPLYEQPISDMYQASEAALAALMVVYDSKADLDAAIIAEQAAELTGYSIGQVSELVQALYGGEQPFLVQPEDSTGTRFGTSGIWLIETAMMQDMSDIDPVEIAKQVLTKAKVVTPVNAWEKHAAGGPYPLHLVAGT